MLSKYIGEMHLSAFPQLGLILFFIAFLLVILWVGFVFSPSAAAEQAQLPLDDERDVQQKNNR